MATARRRKNLATSFHRKQKLAFSVVKRVSISVRVIRQQEMEKRLSIVLPQEKFRFIRTRKSASSIKVVLV